MVKMFTDRNSLQKYVVTSIGSIVLRTSDKDHALTTARRIANDYANRRGYKTLEKTSGSVRYWVPDIGQE